MHDAECRPGPQICLPASMLSHASPNASLDRGTTHFPCRVARQTYHLSVTFGSNWQIIIAFVFCSRRSSTYSPSPVPRPSPCWFLPFALHFGLLRAPLMTHQGPVLRLQILLVDLEGLSTVHVRAPGAPFDQSENIDLAHRVPHQVSPSGSKNER
jgi:hypothetical protein